MAYCAASDNVCSTRRELHSTRFLREPWPVRFNNICRGSVVDGNQCKHHKPAVARVRRANTYLSVLVEKYSQSSADAIVKETFDKCVDLSYTEGACRILRESYIRLVRERER